MGALGAACFRALSDKARDIEKPAWDAERVGMICTKAETFAELKAAILKLCHQTHACVTEEIEKVEKFSERVGRASAKAKKK
jgi:hypothetical protein